MAKASVAPPPPPLPPPSRPQQSNSGNNFGTMGKPRRSRPPPSPEALCRTKVYPIWREAQKERHEAGDVISLVEQCRQFGVGSALWPVSADMYRPPEKNFKALTSGEYTRRNVYDGKQCMDRVMWDDQEFLKMLEDKCPGNDGFKRYQMRLKAQEKEQAARAARPPRSRAPPMSRTARAASPSRVPASRKSRATASPASRSRKTRV